jgi:hypothetical protein
MESKVQAGESGKKKDKKTTAAGAGGKKGVAAREVEKKTGRCARRSLKVCEATDEVIPYVDSSVVSNREAIKAQQEGVRLLMLKFLTDNYSAFCEDFASLNKEGKIRVYTRIVEVAIVKSAEQDKAETPQDNREATIKRMFGLTGGQ